MIDEFLSMIAASPHDWPPRLVLADWLEERGDPRGEMIRLQHHLLSGNWGDPRSMARLLKLIEQGIVAPCPQLVTSQGMELLLIPPGTFVMGSTELEFNQRAGDSVKGPVSATLKKGFWLGKFTVTQREWQGLMGTNLAQQRGKAVERHRLESDMGEGDDFPMYYVTHDEAVEFCKRLTHQECSEGRLHAEWKYTLPTEAHWEYACRAGTSTATAFGDCLSSTQANFWESHHYQTVPVGQYKPNAWGLFDMHGNVWEWCRGVWSTHWPGGFDPEVVPEDWGPVIRGGCWSSNVRQCTSTIQYMGNPEDRNCQEGFRVAAVQVS